MQISADLEESNPTGNKPSEIQDENTVEYDKLLEEIESWKTKCYQIVTFGLLIISIYSPSSSMNIIGIASQCEFGMSLSDKGIMMAAGEAGRFLSVFVWGYITDKIGRRNVALYPSVVACVLMFLSIFVTNIWVFNTLNFFVGLSFGAVVAVIVPYIAELNTANHRDVAINYSLMFVSVAAIYGPAVSWLAMSFDWSLDLPFDITLRPWRLIILLNLLPAIIGMMLLYHLPESPKFLLTQNKEQSAIEAIDWICKFNKGQSLAEALKITNLKLHSLKISVKDVIDIATESGNFLSIIWKTVRPLLRKPHHKNFFICLAGFFLLLLSSNGIQVWFPEIVNRATMQGSNVSVTICEVLNASFKEEEFLKKQQYQTDCIDTKILPATYIDNIVLGGFYVLGFILQGLVINCLGLKKLLLSGISISIISGILLLIVTNSTAILVLFCIFVILPNLQLCVLSSALASLMPIQLRGKANGISLSLGSLGVIVASIMIGLTLQLSCIGTFIIFTLALLICLILVYFLPI